MTHLAPRRLLPTSLLPTFLRPTRLRPTRSLGSTARVSLCALALVLALAGCTGSAQEDTGPEVTLTPRIAAAITLDVLDDRAAESSGTTGEGDAVEASMRFRGTKGYEGDLLTVEVRPSEEGEAAENPCTEEFDGCVQLSKEQSTRLWLIWQLEEPEEDPGMVSLLRVRGGETSRIALYGPVVTDDPRTALAGDRFAVPSLLTVLEDPRLDLVTTEDAIELGERLEGWKD